ncbi:MAG: glycine cleavage system protein H, partial [Actinomycetota bacterium]
MQVPDDLSYTPQHEWVRITNGVARIGITDYAQDALGDVVFVGIPAVGTQVTADQSFTEVESTKSVSDI